MNTGRTQTKQIQLFNGDCLEVMKNIPSESVDMILCDLPYGTTNCSWDTIIDMEQMWIQLKRIRKDKTAILLFAQTPFDKILGYSNIKELKYEWIWEKSQATGHLNSKKMPMKSHENILVFYKNLPTYNPQKTFGHKRKISTAYHKRNTSTGEIYGQCNDFKDYNSTERYPRDVIKFANDKQKEYLHPTQKPVKLSDYLIKTYSNEEEVILDFAMGSGTVGISCLNTNRKFIGIEKDEKYFNISLDRIKKHEPQQEIFYE